MRSIDVHLMLLKATIEFGVDVVGGGGVVVVVFFIVVVVNVVVVSLLVVTDHIILRCGQ